MKHSLKIIQWLFVTVVAALFVWQELGARDFAIAQGLSDLKFRLRGEAPLKKNITLVEVDNRTLEQFSEFGRWPWQRDPQAFLIYSLLKYKPAVLVLDIIYSQAESTRIPLELENDLKKIGRDDLVARYSPDAKMVKIINNYKDKIVLAGGAESLCFKNCEQEKPAAEIAKWAAPARAADPVLENPILNLSEYSEVANHFGFSVAQASADGVIRNIYLRYNHGGLSYPSLALAALNVRNPKQTEASEENLQLNFRSDIRDRHSVSAADILLAEQESSKGAELKNKLRESIENKTVVLGVTASAAGDYHASPVGLLSGPELLVTTIDNLISGDFVRPAGGFSVGAILAVLLLFLFLVQKVKLRWSSVQVLGLYLAAFFIFIFADAYAFLHNVNLSSFWIYFLLTGSLFLSIYEKYSIAEEQKLFIKSAFSKYISPAYVNEILRNPEKLKVGGEKKELTIMFSDIRGFTTFSEKMDAKTLGEFLHEYLDEMTDIVFASRGTLDKYIGDAVMAFWGDPLEATDHGFSACDSAIRMMKWIREKQPYFAAKYGIDLQVGIGIHTGAVSVGNMGSSKSLGYTVIGDAVNLTSRLEGATKEYGVSILATEEVLEQIRISGQKLPPFRELDSLTVKGKNKPVKIVQILDDESLLSTAADFQKGRELYLKRDWQGAIKSFEMCGSDKTAKIFIERCRLFESEPPPSDWDGSWKLTSK